MNFKSYTKGDRKVCYLPMGDNIWVAADIDTKEGVTKDKLVSFLTEKYAQIKDIPDLDVALIIISSQEGELDDFDSLIAKIESLNETERILSVSMHIE